MSLGIGIVGCGMIAGFHARAIRQLRGARLVACHDRSKSVCRKLAEQYSAAAYTNLDSFLAHPDLDIVTICTPSGAHMEPAVAAARAGKHLIVEKPLEVTLRRCDAIIRHCDQAKVVLSTVFQSRFHRSARLVKQAIDSGRFGKLALGDAVVKWFRTQQYYDSGKWRGTWKLDGGGALMNQAIHSIDLLYWLMGPVVQVSAMSARLAHSRIEVEDTAVAAIRFANGALGVIEGTTSAYPGLLKRVAIHGSTGSAVIEEENIALWEFQVQRAADKRWKQEMRSKTETGGGASDPAAISYAGHLQQYRDVLKSIRTGVPLCIDGREGRRSVEIVLAIYQSCLTGRSVDLPLKHDPQRKPVQGR